MIIAGINAYHGNSSVCLLDDDRLILAIEEERLNRIKNWAGFPFQALDHCLSEANLSIHDVDYFAISRDPKAKIFEKALTVLQNPRLFLNSLNRARNASKINNISDDIAKLLKDPKEPQQHLGKVLNIEHHRSHMASSFFASPYDKAALLSIDGMGDFTSTMMGQGIGNDIEVFSSVSYPYSVGYFYTALTQYLGFPNFGDEYKVMGLAPYGNPRYVEELRKVIWPTRNGKFKLSKKCFNHFKQGIKMSWEEGQPFIHPMWDEGLIELLGPARSKDDVLDQRHKDIAASLQFVTEEIVFYLADELYKKANSEVLCLSGGVAQNSVANGKILENTKFKELYVPPAAHDGGTSIGAALYLRHSILNIERKGYQPYAYSGSEFSRDSVKGILEKMGISFTQFEDEDLFDVVSDCISNKGVVGWFQGKSEFGPRALGNRSILADPRDANVRELLNYKIKRRESFRPFAPSVLNERVGDFFDSKGPSPYMEKVFRVRKDKRELIPAVTHVDGTGRLQTVESHQNNRYYNLIKAFELKTSIPILLNTSFNENEPIVNTPQDAINCFLRTKMDMLVVEDIVVRR